MIKLLSIAGARPNFMKLASIASAIQKHNANSPVQIDHIIVHTGQHYDQNMSKTFFDELNIPKPNINLNVGSGSHAVQTAEIMKSFEPVLMNEKPDILLLVGDVNSTVACALVASKINSQSFKNMRPLIVHVEAGLRSFDRSMPEEINRILTDSLSDLLFITEPSGLDNLHKEGIDGSKSFLVGNVMIDTLMCHLEKAEQSTVKSRLGLTDPYCIVTLHRPSNVDKKERLAPLVDILLKMSQKMKLICPLHPRTKVKLEQYGLMDLLKSNSNITLTEPFGYLDFLCLLNGAKMVLTDSGGIQEETTVLKVPCITLRENTERPITITEGSNYLIGSDLKKIIITVDNILAGKGKQTKIPDLWDGSAGERIIKILVDAICP